jgi:hypothetical protein
MPTLRIEIQHIQDELEAGQDSSSTSFYVRLAPRFTHLMLAAYYSG